ncbi:MAG: carbamoyltransferase HypF [Candidatus Omnitrophica bacterium]|nr:carbamoyltransferase HypF [Candidatus Omnitrophota bacterium]
MSQRLRLTIRGAVQGVGFRPHVYRLARELGLNGWVSNSPQGVLLEAEGPPEKLRSFLLRVEGERPPRSFIQSLEPVFLDPRGFLTFEIAPSEAEGRRSALVPPDVAVCGECVKDFLDPANRRYHYPFTSCSHCGPRFSLIESLPYDRPGTTMRFFQMCDLCRDEYEDPANRRHHAQINACPDCGPHVELRDPAGRALLGHWRAISEAAGLIRQGKLLAVKGLGGFHLIADATNGGAIYELRRRKRRDEKPLAVMFPSLEAVYSSCEVSGLEERLLKSAEAPIVILARRKDSDPLVAFSVAPGNPNLGAMLPYTPLHHLLLRELGVPVVATSGNLSEEPICVDEDEALSRLGGVADFFLTHNRRIARPVDDSVARVVMGRELVLRRSRGYAPLPFRTGRQDAPSVLSVGGHLKNTLAQSVGGQVFVSQHIGDLGNEETLKVFRETAEAFGALYETKPEAVACDLHPDYLSTQFAARLGPPPIYVQHHYAHVLACMADNELEGPALGVAFDGTGYGGDGTIWGGEFLRVGQKGFTRFASFRKFRLPGNERAIAEPRRSALGVLYEIFGDPLFENAETGVLAFFSPEELRLLGLMLKKKYRSPLTSSAGRLFDAVASLVGVRQINRFEGQAAMELEFVIGGRETEDRYPTAFLKSGPGCEFDWEETVLGVLGDLGRGFSRSRIAAKFHNTLAEVVTQVAGMSGEKKVVLSGGCFQNQYLLERTVRRLREEGFSVYWHQRIPPNDGGIALGQAVAALRALDRAKDATREDLCV